MAATVFHHSACISLEFATMPLHFPGVGVVHNCNGLPAVGLQAGQVANLRVLGVKHVMESIHYMCYGK